MPRDDTLEGVASRTVETDRLETHVLESGDPDGRPILLLHGTVSSSRFFEDAIADLSGEYRAIAPDLRGHGDSETKPVDAADGLGDLAADLEALRSELGVDDPFTLVGWAEGAGVAMEYAIDRPRNLAALVLVNPLSPYGFGGTKDPEGTPCFDDFAGSGGGLASDELIEGLERRDRGVEGDATPRAILRSFYVDPSYVFEDAREESLLTGMLDTEVGDDAYPGTAVESPNWPGVAPGDRGINNAVSPARCDLTGIVDADPKPPVTWLRGATDQIVSNESIFDFGTLGRMGQIEGWPGEDVFPPQPMVDQTRAVLEEYGDAGGAVEEVVFEDVGHAPHVEVRGEFVDRVESAAPD